ncbi:unnamed protein product [Candida verbasci]|uniref:Uncharacterized protein n=1 Tax=Candida verbasci TaxID=1227364 RepID=A0A9W4U0X9_9ASCO|nr:unnamed protein product [Candida verbasci]
MEKSPQLSPKFYKRFKFWKDQHAETISTATSIQSTSLEPPTSVSSISLPIIKTPSSSIPKDAEDILSSCFNIHIIRIEPNLDQLSILSKETGLTNYELITWFKNIQKILMKYCYHQHIKYKSDLSVKLVLERVDVDPIYEFHLFCFLRVYIIQYFDHVLDDERLESITGLNKLQIDDWLNVKIKKVLKFINFEQDRRLKIPIDLKKKLSIN